MFFRLPAVLFLIFSFTSVFGQAYRIPDSLDYDNSFYNISLEEYLFSREDPKNELTLQQVKRGGLMRFSKQNHMLKHGTYWMFIAIQGNRSGQQSYFLQLNRKISKATGYFEIDNRPLAIQKTGRSLSPKQKDLSQLGENHFSLQLDSGQTAKIWIEIDTFDELLVSPTISLLPHRPFTNYHHFNDIYRAVFTSIFMVLAFYNLILYFTIKESTFLYYAVMIFGFCLHSSLSFMYNAYSGRTVDHISVITAGLIVFSSIRFNYLFMRCDKYFPKWYKLFKLIAYSALIVGGVSAMNLVFVDNLVVFTITSIVVALLALLNTIVSVTFGILIYKKKEKRGGQFLLLNIPAFVGSMIYLFYWLGVHVFEFLERSPENVIFAGVCFYGSVTLQIILLSIIVGLSIRNLEEEKLTIQRNINKKLAQKVKARTSTLNMANNQISQQKERLKRINDVKDRLFSIISHDLRSPMTSLSSVVDLMKLNALTEAESTELANKIGRTLNNTSQLLDNLLYWSKNQMEGIKIQPEKFNIHELIERNIQLLDEAIKEKELDIILNYGDDSEVLADTDMIDLVLRNILSNAIKFSYQKKSIVISTEVIDLAMSVSIKDEGVGIEQEDITKLFRQDTIHTSIGTQSEKGTGLGLVLCHDFLDMNGGKIQMASQGDGTTVTIYLPTAST